MKKSLFVHWQHLLDNIFDPNKSMTTICEIGSHRGKTAEQICLYLLENFKGRFKYIGYDAFELATPDSDNDEINGKGPGNWNYANHLLRRTSMLPTKTNKKFTYKLHRGWTQSTLKENTFDLVYVNEVIVMKQLNTIMKKLKIVKSLCLTITKFQMLRDMSTNILMKIILKRLTGTSKK